MLHTMPQDQVLHQRPRVMPQLMSLSGMKAIRDWLYAGLGLGALALGLFAAFWKKKEDGAEEA